jgi:hypothetical protein
MTDTIHNPISGESNPKSGFVISDATAQEIFRLQLRELRVELIPIIRASCKLPEGSITDERLVEWMTAQIDIAVDRGMQSVRDVVAFLVLLRSVGPRFYEFPAVKKFLTRSDLPVDGKIERMFLDLPVAIWAVVQRHSAIV